MIADALKGMPISPELGAFVAVVMLFLYFIGRWMSGINATISRVSDANNEQIAKVLEANNAHNKAIADDFQGIVRDLNRDARASQRNYQEQLQVLTDSHIKVSRESINMLGDIKVGFRDIEHAFRAQVVKLEVVEGDVRDLKQHRLPPPPEPPRPLPPG